MIGNGMGNSIFGANAICHLLSEFVEERSQDRRSFWRDGKFQLWSDWHLSSPIWICLWRRDLKTGDHFGEMGNSNFGETDISYVLCDFFVEERSEDKRSVWRDENSQLLIFFKWKIVTQVLQIVCADGVLGFCAQVKATVEREDCHHQDK